MTKLDAIRDAKKKNVKLQLQVKKFYDRTTSQRKFKVGSMVSMWNARSKEMRKHGKFDALWLCPYLFSTTHGEDSYYRA